MSFQWKKELGLCLDAHIVNDLDAAKPKSTVVWLPGAKKLLYTRGVSVPAASEPNFDDVLSSSLVYASACVAKMCQQVFARNSSSNFLSGFFTVLWTVVATEVFPATGKTNFKDFGWWREILEQMQKLTSSSPQHRSTFLKFSMISKCRSHLLNFPSGIKKWNFLVNYLILQSQMTFHLLVTWFAQFFHWSKSFRDRKRFRKAHML